MTQTIRVNLDYLPVSRKFKFRHWVVSHAWKRGAPRATEAVLTHGLVAQGHVTDLPQPQDGDKRLAFERVILRVGSANGQRL